MANLVLKRFQCVEDTNESGGESPYFIALKGVVGELDIVTFKGGGQYNVRCAQT
jgi:hypothetical protein